MTATVEALRTCQDCGVQAFTADELEGFVKGTRHLYGRQNRCKPCNNARSSRWQNDNRDRYLEYQREYSREYYSGAFRDRMMWDVRELSYISIHIRLNAHFGKASDYECVHCNGPAREWAYTHDDEDPRYGVSGNGYTVAYSLKPEYYQPMCATCHRAFDAGHR